MTCQLNKRSFYWDVIPVNNGNHKKFPNVWKTATPRIAADLCVHAWSTGQHLLTLWRSELRPNNKKEFFYGARSFCGSPQNPHSCECSAEEDWQQWSLEGFLTLSFWPWASQLPLLDHCPLSPSTSLPLSVCLSVCLSVSFFSQTTLLAWSPAPAFNLQGETKSLGWE